MTLSFVGLVSNVLSYLRRLLTSMGIKNYYEKKNYTISGGVILKLFIIFIKYINYHISGNTIFSLFACIDKNNVLIYWITHFKMHFKPFFPYDLKTLQHAFFLVTLSCCWLKLLYFRLRWKLISSLIFETQVTKTITFFKNSFLESSEVNVWNFSCKLIRTRWIGFYIG